MERIGHKAISASAGSGKTFQLAHRYIELMARGVKPDRIIALTFSRKAAGEIFDSVVRYLCRAASSSDEAARTAGIIGRAGMQEREFLHTLRGLLENLHRLQIGTLDSFTVGVAQTFPLELGIPPRFSLLEDDGAAGNARKEVLSRIFSQHEGGPAVRDEFLQAYKQATFGREEKSLEGRLDTMIADYRGFYQVLPEAERWGCEEVIWPAGCHWLNEDGDVKAAAVGLERLLREDNLKERLFSRWQTFVETVSRYETGSTWSRDIEFLFAKLSSQITALREGYVTLKLDGVSRDLSSEHCRLVLVMMAHIMKTELTTVLEKTKGVYRVLDLYETFYDAMLRRHGRLTFSDVQYLLTASNNYSGGSVLSRLPSTEARLYMDYRLDCKLDHWLLDEFQDTSDLQWEVLRNLADEILQDNSGRRSFFYVGDAKQAIYGWRGGNARLFGRIIDHYGEKIELSHLSTSFRSCQPVIDTVNRIFGRIAPGLLPENTMTQWQRSWQEHQCQQDAVPQVGYAALLEPRSDEGKTKPIDEDRYGVVAALLREIDPLSKGLSVAVLVRTNNNGKAIADYLRRECPDMRIVHEGLASIEDNPVVSVLLSLVKFAAHPGDTFAWRHLQMSPLGDYFARERLNRSNLSLVLLRQIQAEGFQSLVRCWGQRLDAAYPLDAFGRKRLHELVGAAIEFDRGERGDCNTFLRFIEAYQTHDLATDDAVRVMTIHQSKGLGFDLVIAPDLQNGNMVRANQSGFAMARHPDDGRPLWALEMPRRIIAETDEVLKEQLAFSDETAAFDALCLLYVALTRARQGLYMVTSFPGKSSEVLTPAAFLKRQLMGSARAVEGKRVVVSGEEFVCLYETGKRDWYALAEAPSVAPCVQPPGLAGALSNVPSRRRRLLHVQPSKGTEFGQRAGLLFAPAARESRDLGTAIHELISGVKWIDEVDLDRLITEWCSRSAWSEDIKNRAVEEVRQLLSRPDVRRALTRPAGEPTLWREKKFEVVLGEHWVTGAFDRVMVFRDEKARPLRAIVLDFKSDEVSETSDLRRLEERYRSQMTLYRGALARILSVVPERIGLKLLFTRVGKVVDIEGSRPADEQLSLW